jgi:alkaline phosphatase
MATGNKVSNLVIAEAIPARGTYAYGDPFPTLLDIAKGQGKSTGLITSSYIADATPAAFAAHVPDRSQYANIANYEFSTTHVNVLMGATNGLPANVAQNAGYTVVQSLAELQAVNLNTTSYLSAQFSNGYGYYPYEAQGVSPYPHLSQMAAASLDMLDNDPDGFFLMVEGGSIDPASHANSTANTVPDVVEFSNTVQTVLNWAAGRTDTLVIVTADHECGGITAVQNNGRGVLPTITWTSTGHTGVNVPVYAWGVNGRMLTGTIQNTQYFQIIQAASSTLLGDVNLDGAANALDISSFIRYVTGGGPAPMEADYNRDGVVNALGISSFIAAVRGGRPAQVVPEPTSGALIALMVVGGGRGWWRRG